MRVRHNKDGSAELRFDYDPAKVKVARVLGGDFKKGKGGDARWTVRAPEMVALIRRSETEAKNTSRPFYPVLLEHIHHEIERSQASEPTEIENIEVPEGKRLMQHQESALDWLLSHPSALVADPMGAGKTIICAIEANHVKAKRVLIVCLASIKANWRMEWRAWNMMCRRGEQTVALARGSFWPGTDVVIVNYDIIDRFRTKYKYHNGKPVYDESGERVVERMGQIDSVDWDMVILDECHKIKGRGAQRTRAIIGHWSRGKLIQEPIRAKRKRAMSGTPIPNRPSELWPTAFWLWPESFPSFHMFGMRYCGAKRRSVTKKRKAWDFRGSSNSKELNARCRLLGMIARSKEITHREVPPKSRQIIEFPIHGLENIIKDEKDMYREHGLEYNIIRDRAERAAAHGEEGTFRSEMKELRSRVTLDVGRLTAARQAVSRAKLPHVIEYVKQELQTRDKIVLFCWHREVADKLARAFPNTAKIDGVVDSDRRQAEIDKFQNDPECHVFVGTIAAAGTGVTLTAADLMLFVELHWVPGDMAQAEDRCHRKGQLRPLEIRYLVVEGSADSVMSERIVEKIEVIEACTGPLEAAMHNIPVSIEQEEDDDFDFAEGNDLTGVRLDGKPEKDYTPRDWLRQIARARCRKRPTQAVQIYAGRLSNMAEWNEDQKILANTLIGKYCKHDATQNELF